MKSIKISDGVYKKIQSFKKMLAKKEFSGAKISVSDALSYALAKTKNNAGSKPFGLGFKNLRW